MKRLAIVLAVTAVLGGLFVFGLLRGEPDRDITSNLIGRQMPDFEIPLYERYQATYGPTIGPDAREGRPMVVNFWASWCGPCYDEAPELQTAWRRYGDEVLFLGIQTQDRDKRAEGRAFIEQFALGFPNAYDNDSRVGIAFGLFGVPETFFIRADGTVAYKHAGPVTEQVLDEQIAGLIR